MAKKVDISYSEAMAEIEKILSSLQSSDCDVEALAKRVERASELIDLCRKRLRKAEADVDKLFVE
ncbi:MAG: exodeoxyribonuclease VII small subunit [Alistipes sp.]|nr:exodeoxyribonuclease VII small subunit [Alistipes sp.]MBQ9961890.1 exodeoxyribonuclease VII small subunit [Alistipes sp.]